MGHPASFYSTNMAIICIFYSKYAEWSIQQNLLLFHFWVIAIYGHRASLVSLTMLLIWYFYFRWCPRGVPRDPNVEKHFSSQILQWNLHHICMDYKKQQFCKKKKKKKSKCCTVSKWRPNNRFLFRVISILAKIWKTTFPKEFFNEIWLKVGKHGYIYITEITF